MEVLKSPKTALLKKPYLSIKILEIANLPFDPQNKLKGYMAVDDCYIQVNLKHQEKKNPSGTPKWFKSFEMEVESSNYSFSSLQIFIFDKYGLQPNHLLAMQTIPLSLLPIKAKAVYTDQWISLLPQQVTSSFAIFHADPSSPPPPLPSPPPPPPLHLPLPPFSPFFPTFSPPPLATITSPSPSIPSFSHEIVERSFTYLPSILPPPFLPPPSSSYSSSSTPPQIKIGILCMDQASLWIIKATIYEIEEVSEKEFFKVSSFYYKVLLQRNDGLEWRIRKRYSDFRIFRKRMIKTYEKVGEILFPRKKYLKYFSWVSNFNYKLYKEAVEDKKYKLQHFLDELLKMEEIKENELFQDFFTENFN